MSRTYELEPRALAAVVAWSVTDPGVYASIGRHIDPARVGAKNEHAARVLEALRALAKKAPGAGGSTRAVAQHFRAQRAEGKLTPEDAGESLDWLTEASDANEGATDREAILAQVADVLRAEQNLIGIGMMQTLHGKRCTDLGPALKVLEEARGIGARAAAETVYAGADIFFGELGAPNWLVEGLQLVPGRPAILGGYGSAGKSLVAQSIALAVASGTPVFGEFAVRQGRVLHLDFEQGERATRLRYRRLARGYGLDPRTLADNIEVRVFPSVRLNAAGAEDALRALCTGFDLVIIDSLRGAASGADENDSRIRECLDVLTRTSGSTGATYLLLHHTGKPRAEGGKRYTLRGSSALYDGAGAILIIDGGADLDAEKVVTQERQAAEASGRAMAPFRIRIEDVEDAEDMPAVRCTYLEGRGEPAAGKAAAQVADDRETLLAVIRKNPGLSQRAVILESGISRTRARDLLDDLEERGDVIVRAAARGSKTYHPADSADAELPLFTH